MDHQELSKKFPQSWQNSPKISTLSELKSIQKSSKIPDPSFDLDGDGIVSGHDLIISSQFDKDKDGKLSPQERSEALKALSQGYSNNFLWGCESSGLNRSFRIVQKRGKIIPNEEFSPVQETYPNFPNDSKNFSKSQLIEQRKLDRQIQAKQSESKLNTVFQKSVPIESFLCKDHYIESPLYSSMHMKKNNENQVARERAGLSMEPINFRDAEVKFDYKKNPENLSLAEMKMKKKQRLVNDLNASADYSHLTFYKKVENEKAFVGPKGRILKDVLRERREKDIGHLEETFIQKVTGIHGRELPKFEENLKICDGFEKISKDVSDFVQYQKKIRRSEEKIDDVPLKPNQVVHEFMDIPRRNKASSKFTQYYSIFMPYSSVNQETVKERIKLEKIKKEEVKKNFKFLIKNETVPPITKRLLRKLESLSPKNKNISTTGFAFK